MEIFHLKGESKTVDLVYNWPRGGFFLDKQVWDQVWAAQCIKDNWQQGVFVTPWPGNLAFVGNFHSFNILGRILHTRFRDPNRNLKTFFLLRKSLKKSSPFQILCCPRMTFLTPTTTRDWQSEIYPKDAGTRWILTLWIKDIWDCFWNWRSFRYISYMESEVWYQFIFKNRYCSTISGCSVRVKLLASMRFML